ncbi:hypothetical protein BC830DRAFT_1100849 [Chytriomyces sp. MP71]|nr:hypothetical protein BC830DRAFT_1100849 [Chytriomyces sp. MP71]
MTLLGLESDHQTTPFEEKGKLTILNGRYDILSLPQYSFDITDLITPKICLCTGLVLPLLYNISITGASFYRGGCFLAIDYQSEWARDGFS